MDKKSKPGRIIFQPDYLTDLAIRGYCFHTDGSVGDFINGAVHHYFLPTNEALQLEVAPLLEKCKRNIEITEKELQGTLSRCIGQLRNHPVSNSHSLQQIMFHFMERRGNILRYDYIIHVNDYYDVQLTRLNEILKTLDPTYNMGQRELGERCRDIFKHWNILCQYPEIYDHLATITLLENIYLPLDVYETLCLIKNLDLAIQKHSISANTEEFHTTVTLQDRVNALQYQILVYQCDNGYGYLSGDSEFKLPPEMKNYYANIKKVIKSTTFFDSDDFKVYYEDLTHLNEQGRNLLRRLAAKNPAFDEIYN